MKKKNQRIKKEGKENKAMNKDQRLKERRKINLKMNNKEEKKAKLKMYELRNRNNFRSLA